jgi:hypothetical protein
MLPTAWSSAQRHGARPLDYRHIGDAVPVSARADASSEQRRTQLRKYRLAIEPIARRYMPSCVFRAFHSAALWKSKPSGI